MYGGKLQVYLQFDKRDLPGRESDWEREDAKIGNIIQQY
jgi:hypothetical protein